VAGAISPRRSAIPQAVGSIFSLCSALVRASVSLKVPRFCKTELSPILSIQGAENACASCGIFLCGPRLCDPGLPRGHSLGSRQPTRSAAADDTDRACAAHAAALGHARASGARAASTATATRSGHTPSAVATTIYAAGFAMVNMVKLDLCWPYMRATPGNVCLLVAMAGASHYA
jgi:hypothetical protein